MAVVLLGGVCASLAAVHVSNNPLDTVKGHPSSVTGANLLAGHYGAGVNDPVTVLARPAEASAAAAAARATHGVATVTPGGPVGGYASYSVTLSVPPYGSGRPGRDPGPAQPPGPRRTGLAGRRRPGHPVRHHPGRAP